MQIKGIKELNLILNLYFSRYNNKKSVGTIADIAKEITMISMIDESIEINNKISPSPYSIKFVRELAKEGVIKKAGEQEFKGKIYDTYYIDIKLLEDYIKNISEFYKSYFIIRDIISNNKFGVITEIYTMDEINEFEKKYKSLNKKE